MHDPEVVTIFNHKTTVTALSGHLDWHKKIEVPNGDHEQVNPTSESTKHGRVYNIVGVGRGRQFLQDQIYNKLIAIKMHRIIHNHAPQEENQNQLSKRLM